jgi:hypothetical protein
MGVAGSPFRPHDARVNGRLGRAVVAVGAAVLCLAAWGVLSLLDDGRLRSILIVPLAVTFFWGLAALLGSVVGVIFGDPGEEWTRLGMLAVGICAAMFGGLLIGVASWHDVGGHAIEVALRAVGSLGFWVSITALAGAIFGELPEIGMSEGD